MEVQVTVDAKEVVEEMFWLAWNACGGTQGYGFLQDKPEASREEVLVNVGCSGDYDMHISTHSGQLYGDYVFGRMMKLGLNYEKGIVIFRDTPPRADYQSWCVKYPSYIDLLNAALASLKEK